jgi:SAM-dependent methyltransferase
MQTKFDHEAIQYDDNFTNSKIGRLQRNGIWSYLDKFLIGREEIEVLELNCGTGEDAIYLAGKGHKVLATDSSQKMLNVGEAKSNAHNLSSLITFSKLDLKDPNLGKSNFDFVFSNFGGLNCISPLKLKSLASFLIDHTKPFSECIFVIMPRQTFMEKLFRMINGTSRVYSSKSNNVPLSINVSGESAETYFYNPEEFLSYFPGFKLEKKISVGYLPSYMNNSRFLPFLLLIEKLLFAIRLSPKRSDHYLLHLKKQS